MSDGTDSDRGNEGEVTLAFDLAAIDKLANPQDVFTDARRWSRYVGVVADDPPVVAPYVRTHGLQQDFELGDVDKQSVLSKLKWEADTDRYVFVGASKENRALADHVGWEYIPVDEAAEKADWALAEDAGILEEVQTRLTRLSPWSF